MQVASDERKNIIMDDANIPAGLDRLDLILKADAKRNTERDAIAEIKERLDNIDAMIAYVLNMLDDEDLDYDDPDPYAAEALGDEDIDDPLVEDVPDYEDPDADGADGKVPDHLNDDPYADIEIPPPDGWDPGAEGNEVADGDLAEPLDGEVPEGHGRLRHGLDPNREHWRDIDGFPNYEVSHYGNVRNKTTGRFLRPFPNQKGYLRVELRHAGRGKTHCVHVLVADAWIPKIDDKPQVDHIDRNKANNMLHNLRRCTPEENMWNRGLLRNNTTGVRGVTRCGNKYRADITANKRKHYLGLFDTLEEAADARRRAELEHHGAFAG